MTSQDKFIALTRKGEDTRIEYKTCTEEISESLYESVCSLLNHSGGQILVGVQNDGTIIGVNPEKVEQLRTDIGWEPHLVATTWLVLQPWPCLTSSSKRNWWNISVAP